MELTLREVIEAINGKILIQKKEEFNNLCIDTRRIEENNIYLAIKGETFNGNNFVEEAFKKGASIAIVDEILFDIEKASGTVILVENTLNALLELANYYRRKLNLKVVGITGSCGKTSTKDLVAGFLSSKYKVFKTKGNFNNQIGLPLMILELDSSHDVAVLEMGMSDLNEIDLLAKTAMPDLALITNIGLSHIENLKTQENIFKAKMEIVNYFNEKNTLILNSEDNFLAKVNNKCFEIFKIGYNCEYDVFASNIILEEDKTIFTANYKGESSEFIIPMAGKHNVLNSLLAIGVSLKLGLSFEEMKAGIKNIEATSMRLQVIKKDNITIINDCYNASPDSMKSALDVLSAYKEGRKIAILGNMNELGHKSFDSHKEVGIYAKDKVDNLIVIGDYLEAYEEGYAKENIIKFKTKEEFIENIKNTISLNDVILVKASRGVKFENIVLALKNADI